MDPATIAAGVVTLVAGALTEAGRTFADKALKDVVPILGKTVGQKVAAVFENLVTVTEEKPYTAPTVERVVKTPDNQDAREMLRLQLKQLMEDDATLAKRLEQLLEDAKPEAKQAGIVVSGSGAVATSGGVAAGQGGIAAGGDVNTAPPRPPADR